MSLGPWSSPGQTPSLGWVWRGHLGVSGWKAAQHCCQLSWLDLAGALQLARICLCRANAAWIWLALCCLSGQGGSSVGWKHGGHCWGGCPWGGGTAMASFVPSRARGQGQRGCAVFWRWLSAPRGQQFGCCCGWGPGSGAVPPAWGPAAVALTRGNQSCCPPPAPALLPSGAAGPEAVDKLSGICCPLLLPSRGTVGTPRAVPSGGSCSFMAVPSGSQPECCCPELCALVPDCPWVVPCGLCRPWL